MPRPCSASTRAVGSAPTICSFSVGRARRSRGQTPALARFYRDWLVQAGFNAADIQIDWQRATQLYQREQRGESLTAEELRQWLSERTAKFWLPERWSFITEVPKTSVGKIDKKRLRQELTDLDSIR